jgi:hypothetical protein
VSTITHHSEAWRETRTWERSRKFHPQLASESTVTAQEMIDWAEEQSCVDRRWNAHRPPRLPLPCRALRVHDVMPASYHGPHLLTSCLLREFLPPNQILLLILHQLKRGGIQRLLQLGQVDLYVSPSASALASASHAPRLARVWGSRSRRHTLPRRQRG